MDDGLEKISHVLIEEARVERERLLAASRKNAAELLKAAEGQADLKKKDIVAQAKREADAFRENELAKARMDAKVGILNAKDRIADHVFEQSLGTLAALKKKKEYQKIILEMICKAALEGEGELVVSGEDAKLFGKKLILVANRRIAKKNAKLSLSGESRKMAGGFILSYPEKGIELNRSFESILSESRERNMPQIAKILFEEKD